MIYRSSLLLFASLMIFSGCTLLKPKEVIPPFDPGAFRLELDALPGAVVRQGETLTVSYPGETLFGAASAIPFPGGTEILDPLVRLIVAHPEVRWEGTVRIEEEVAATYGEDLIEKRRELLTLFFTRRGVSEERLPISVGSGEGAPFEVAAYTQDHSTPSGNSSGEKQ